ncbi:MAG: thiamine pyrophosphate-dependent dehydrogenase E1 component subunit alpha [Burkholderiales bacterium]
MSIRYQYTGTGFRDWTGRTAGYDGAFLLRLFRSMLRIRIIEEEIEKRYHEDQMKTPIHLVIGQEATSVGCCAALTDADLLYSSHRTHGNYLAKGGDLKSMLSEMFCRANGCVGSRGGSMHLIDKKVGMAGTSAIVGGAIPIATGAALATQMQKLDRVCVVFLGEAGAEEGVTSESLNFAAVKRLPVIYFCENNHYSVQSPLAPRQSPDRVVWKWAASYGMHSVPVDGTNVLAVYEATKEAVGRARRGGGPTFIEAQVYRFRAHGGAGDDSKTGYRDMAEREAWENHCPIATYDEFLRSGGVLDAAARKQMEGEILAETLAAFDHAMASADPVEADLYRNVYAS